MKHVKRLLAVTLAMVMVLGTQVTMVLAEEEPGVMETAGTDVNVEKENTGEMATNVVDIELGNAVNSSENAGEENVDVESDMIETYAAGDVVESGICGENLTYELTGDGTLTISGTGEMDDAYSGGSTAFLGIKDQIKTVVIEDGITWIGEYAFDSCVNLMEVQIPDSVTGIAHHAFSGCSVLETIEIPDSVIGWGSYVFGDCVNLKNIKISESITEIADATFYRCGNLEKIEIPNKVTQIGDAAFEGCLRLEEIRIPDGVDIIGSEAFRECMSLRNIEIPESVVIIGAYTFQNCISLRKIKLPQKVDEISSYMFDGCSGLTDVEMPAVQVIETSAFSGCSSLKTITLPNGITDIGENAFENCSGLTEIRIPLSWINQIGNAAFKNCLALKSVYFEEAAPRFLKNYDESDEWFSGVTATIYYPYGYYVNGDLGWSDDVMQNYGGTLTWQPWNLYIVEEATDSVYVKGSPNGATIKCTEELGKFISVAIDGIIVEPSDYTVIEGSTVLTFLSAYLDALSVGEHVVTLNYTYGSIDTTMTILDKKNTDNSGNMMDGNMGNEADINGSNAGNVNNGGNNVENTSNGNQANINGANGAPKTGDMFSPWMLWSLCAASGIFVLALMIRRKSYLK